MTLKLLREESHGSNDAHKRDEPPTVLPFSSPQWPSVQPQLTEDSHEEPQQTENAHEEVSKTKTVTQVKETRIYNRTTTIRSETPPTRQQAHAIRSQLYDNHIQQST